MSKLFLGETIIGRNNFVNHVQSGKIRDGATVNVFLENPVKKTNNIYRNPIVFESVLTVKGNDVTVDYEGKTVTIYSPVFNNFTASSLVGFRYLN